MYRYDNFLGILLASLFPLVFAGVAQPGQTPKGEPQRRTHNFNVGDPEVAGSKNTSVRDSRPRHFQAVTPAGPSECRTISQSLGVSVCLSPLFQVDGCIASLLP